MVSPRDQNVIVNGVLTVEEVATFDVPEIVNGLLTVTTREAPDQDRTWVEDGKLTVVEGVGVPAWVMSGAFFDFDHANDRYWRDAELVALADASVFDRNSVGKYVNSDGDWAEAAADVVRRHLAYDPAGVLIEEPATNSHRNAVLAGGAVGSPGPTGTLPTNMARASGNLGGAAVTVSAIGTEDGINYIDFTFAGTASGGNGDFTLWLEDYITVTASQVYDVSAWMKLVSGSLSNTSFVSFQTIRYNSTVYASDGGLLAMKAILTADWQRFEFPDTVPGSGVNQVRPRIFFRVPNGQVANAVIRIGWPQVVVGDTEPSSPIVTTGAAATREADNLTVDVTGAGLRTLAADFRLHGYPTGASAAIIAQADDGTSNNRARIVYVPSTGKLRGVVTVGGVDQADLELGDYTLGARRQAALSWSDDLYSGALDGAAAVTDTSGDDLTGLTTVRYGGGVSLATPANIVMHRLTGLPVAVSADGIV